MADRTWWILAAPVLPRLSRRWADEERLFAGLTCPSMRWFALVKLGLVERRRSFFSRRWMIRLA